MLVSQSGIKPMSPALEGGLLTTDHQGSSKTKLQWQQNLTYSHISHSSLNSMQLFCPTVQTQPPQNTATRTSLIITDLSLKHWSLEPVNVLPPMEKGVAVCG